MGECVVAEYQREILRFVVSLIPLVSTVSNIIEAFTVLLVKIVSESGYKWRGYPFVE